MDFQNNQISVILLAGGKGLRLGSNVPKQFLKLKGKELALFSFELFIKHPQISEVVVVCDSHYHSLFKTSLKPVLFAQPGASRQESAYNGLLKIKEHSSAYVCVHDAARPCLDSLLLNRVIKKGVEHGAATLAVPAISTLKEVDEQNRIVKTLQRSKIWTIQTPQVVRKDWLIQGFEKVAKEHIEVTDDVSIAEILGHPAYVVESSAKNIKLTVPSDLKLVEALLEESR